MEIEASRNLDKPENAKNNEILILDWPPECLKSHKTVLLRQSRLYIIGTMRNSGKF